MYITLTVFVLANSYSRRNQSDETDFLLVGSIGWGVSLPSDRWRRLAVMSPRRISNEFFNWIIFYCCWI